MREIKHVLQMTVVLLAFVFAVMVLLKSCKVFVQGYQMLGNKVEHPSIGIMEEDWKENTTE